MTFTSAELRALREACGFRLAGETDGLTQGQEDALRSAHAKLAALPANVRLVPLTPAQARAADLAIGQMTDANVDFDEWRKQTSGTFAEYRALCRAQVAIRKAARHPQGGLS